MRVFRVCNFFFQPLQLLMHRAEIYFFFCGGGADVAGNIQVCEGYWR